MNEYKNIEIKLRNFIRKYHTNVLIKGGILFFTFGFLYLFFTLFIEYFLWLQPTARTILFWIFILVEGFLLFRFICIPIFKLIGLQKGISLADSSKIIGSHFPEVADKLLNILQLKETTNQSDLILASIHQKSKELQPIPFVKAIDFKQNATYLKYLLIPVLIWLITLFTGNNTFFNEPFNRVVNHRTAYNPPAPFAFFILNKDLQVIQGKPLTITVKTAGNVVPSEAKITFNNQQYYLQNKGNGLFSYTFSAVETTINFQLEANEIQSQNYTILVIKTPTIKNISTRLKYPKYIGIKNKEVNNLGNFTVPEGTKVTWKVTTNQTDSLVFINNKKRSFFNSVSKNDFQFSKKIKNSFDYEIASSNTKLQDYENLQFSVEVIKDEFPQISITSDIDSISHGTAQFAGQISDDYGLQKLQLVYYDEENPQNINTLDLPITKENIQTFFYQFPDGITLNPGVNYQLYFIIFDNDGVNGSKKTSSKVFNYRNKTTLEIKDELLNEQKETINNLENSFKNQQKQQKELDEIKNSLQQKQHFNWNDKKKVQQFVKRQNQYKQMMQRQTEMLQQNLEEKTEQNYELKERKEELKQRIEELKKLNKQQKLLKEIEKLANKINKEDLLKKAKEFAQQNKQQQRSLERILELTKRFYIEQKTMQIANKINELAKKQDDVVAKKQDNIENQNNIKKQFDNIKKDLDNLLKDNEKLQKPMKLPPVDEDAKKINKELIKTAQNLGSKNSKEAKKYQKNASKKMKEMSAKMQQSMSEVEGEFNEENMEDFRKILENVVTFSFKQETLMNKFNRISTVHPDFGKELKNQNTIKTYFEHIDDSLYVLSLRLPKISVKIQEDLTSAHYNLDLALDNFSDNKFSNGISNQRYVMTAVNNLADYLSEMLTSMKKSMSMKMGKGKGKKSKGFSLLDLIKKQESLSKKMEDGQKKGKKPDKSVTPGEKGKNKGQGEGELNEDLDGEIYKIYKEQNQLRQELQDAINEGNPDNPKGNNAAKRALKTMEQLENEILEKGFNQNTLQKMKNLQQDLLKLDNAVLEQGEEKKRKANVNLKEHKINDAKAIKFKKQFYNQTEILNRQSLPLQQNYKKKVREYFSRPFN